MLQDTHTDPVATAYRRPCTAMRASGRAHLPEPHTLAALLALGLVLGMKHALEADHVAAVAALATGSRSVMQTVLQGVVWGVGHTLALLVFAGAVVALDAAVPARLAALLEFGVGAMLVLLGLDVLRRLARAQIHFHVHRHDGGLVHVHAHSHAGERAPHDAGHHHHAHPAQFPLRALAVGTMHGMAGSAALIVLTVAAVRPVALGFLQIAAFGAGSILGMAALSLAIAIPMQRSATLLTWAHRGLKSGVGLGTVALGAFMMYQIAAQGFVIQG